MCDCDKHHDSSSRNQAPDFFSWTKYARHAHKKTCKNDKCGCRSHFQSNNSERLALRRSNKCCVDKPCLTACKKPVCPTSVKIPHFDIKEKSPLKLKCGKCRHY